jgi:hypothetical protein
MSRSTLLMLSFLMPLCAAGCMTHTAAPPGLDLALTRPTDQNRYVVTLQPPAAPIRINQMHAWEIRVTSASGEPVAQARIDVDGGMPQHGHGFPTHPAVTQELGDGRYLLQGMKFSMTGWWEIKLSIRSATGADRVTFNTVISLPTAESRSATSRTSAGNHG